MKNSDSLAIFLATISVLVALLAWRYPVPTNSTMETEVKYPDKNGIASNTPEIKKPDDSEQVYNFKSNSSSQNNRKTLKKIDSSTDALSITEKMTSNIWKSDTGGCIHRFFIYKDSIEHEIVNNQPQNRAQLMAGWMMKIIYSDVNTIRSRYGLTTVTYENDINDYNNINSRLTSWAENEISTYRICQKIGHYGDTRHYGDTLRNP